MNEQKLKSCPFCGESPRMKEDKNSCGELFYQVRHDCKHLLSVIKTFCYTTEAEATEAWNRRAPLPDNCANNDCPYQCGEPCPARDGCGGFTPDNKALTVEELREMNGQPVWCSELECHGIIAVDSSGRWKDMPFLCGRWEQADFKYDIDSRGLTIYRRPPEKGE